MEKLKRSDINNMTLEEARDAITIFAKRANQRLRQLEKDGFSQQSNAYRKIEAYHYDQREFMDTTRKGQPKFSTKLKGRSLNDLRKELKQLDMFLNVSRTTTKAGINQMYRKAYDTFTQNYGDDLSYHEYISMWQDARIETWVERYGSDEVIRWQTDMNKYEFTDEEREMVRTLIDERKSIQTINDEIERIRSYKAGETEWQNYWDR